MCASYSCRLRITAVESLRIRGFQNSSARTCESNKGVLTKMRTTADDLWKRPQNSVSKLFNKWKGPSNPGLRVCTATPIYWSIKCVKFLSQNSIGVSIKSTHFLKIELAHEKSQLTSPKLSWLVKFYIRIIRYVFEVTLASRHDHGMPASADQLKSAKQST